MRCGQGPRAPSVRCSLAKGSDHGIGLSLAAWEEARPCRACQELTESQWLGSTACRNPVSRPVRVFSTFHLVKKGKLSHVLGSSGLGCTRAGLGSSESCISSSTSLVSLIALV